MPNYRRAVQPGGTFFFTVTFDRQPILKSADALSLLRQSLNHAGGSSV